MEAKNRNFFLKEQQKETKRHFAMLCVPVLQAFLALVTRPFGHFPPPFFCFSKRF